MIKMMSIKTVMRKEINAYIESDKKDALTPILKEVKDLERKEKKNAQIWITTHKGKMRGFQSISTNNLTNEFCKKASLNKSWICSKCYANRLLTIREGLCEKMERNTRLLSERVIPIEELPTINALYFRFNSFGEIINENHIKNLINICLKNPKVNFTLWTKRIIMINCFVKPSNLFYVYSNPIINNAPKRVISGFDKVFTVYSSKYVKENNIKINCMKSCLKCLKCYTKNNIGIINEELK